MSANDRQIGGEHYNKSGEQHWDRIYRLYGRGYFVGCATKYLERYHLKNGKEDLDKAIHFIEKLRELEYPSQVSADFVEVFKESARNAFATTAQTCLDELSKCDATRDYIDQDR